MRLSESFVSHPLLRRQSFYPLGTLLILFERALLRLELHFFSRR
jgi:hypothetical protein